MQQTGTKEVQELAWLGWKFDLLGIVQKLKVWLYQQIDMH